MDADQYTAMSRSTSTAAAAAATPTESNCGTILLTPQDPCSSSSASSLPSTFHSTSAQSLSGTGKTQGKTPVSLPASMTGLVAQRRNLNSHSSIGSDGNSSSSSSTRPHDPYYGFKDVSVLCTDFITALYHCPSVPTPTTTPTTRRRGRSKPEPTLAQFIAYALYRTRLPSAVVFAALLLLQRLKRRFPSSRGTSGHRLFLASYMIAAKTMCDDTYSNKSWSIVAQNMFALFEINKMERELCEHLDWRLTLNPEEVLHFEALATASVSASASASASAQLTPTTVPSTPSLVPSVIPASDPPALASLVARLTSIVSSRAVPS